MNNNPKQTPITIERFEKSQENTWDDFILHQSYNGAFVATRIFLNYHPEDRFVDHSLIIKKNRTVIAVVPACEINDRGKRVFFSHRGATFGGIIVSKEFFDVAYVAGLIDAFEKYLGEEGFDEVVLKQMPAVFSEGSTTTLDFMLGYRGFLKYEELSFVVSIEDIADDVLGAFRLQTRQQVVQGHKLGAVVKEFSDEQTISNFHLLLSKNLARHDAKPVHSVAELLDLKKRFPENIHFYGCFSGERMIGGVFMWQYGNRVLHEQNMATDEEFVHLRPANVLNHFVIEETIRRGLPYFSFGISTEDHGKKLNFGLARFKEGFGAKGFINSTYHKTYAN